jgi:hypothetical protein
VSRRTRRRCWRRARQIAALLSALALSFLSSCSAQDRRVDPPPPPAPDERGTYAETTAFQTFPDGSIARTQHGSGLVVASYGQGFLLEFRPGSGKRGGCGRYFLRLHREGQGALPLDLVGVYTSPADHQAAMGASEVSDLGRLTLLSLSVDRASAAVEWELDPKETSGFEQSPEILVLVRPLAFTPGTSLTRRFSSVTADQSERRPYLGWRPCEAAS